MARVEFSQTVKDALAKRAGFKCSFPGCRASTIGPSTEGPEKSSSSGMACHIAAASGGPGARRVIPGMTAAELSSIENGIWMCFSHGKLIDTDEVRFTIPMLKHWRKVAERRAQLEHEHGRDINLSMTLLPDLGLADEAVQVTELGQENKTIGDAILYSCLREVWGRDVADAIRDLSIEIARNALVHGGATTFSLTVEKLKVTLRDNGSPYNYTSIFSEERHGGGAMSISCIINQFADRLVFSSSHNGLENETIVALVREPNDVSALVKCSIQIRLGHRPKADPDTIKLMMECDTVYIVHDESYISYSDIFFIRLYAEQYLCSKRCVFVCKDASDGVLDKIKEAMPSLIIMALLPHQA
ncbi:hypothetical protein [Microvirga sp. M2]|uniref:hypothetical protein n=1 Tax=Microvirga sp. M2 TaxID=3073270 RepID=UPI0039C04FED